MNLLSSVIEQEVEITKVARRTVGFLKSIILNFKMPWFHSLIQK
jgi:hypothetical protein